ncbi:hypothetical protein Moror_9785 [Moniliophthora roreri MCA 2997]|uniref:Uncharacterized protein n=1 Tax=Moniliophthora roreri (strain MCA 2997) TaxID=1381753 RepID=V2WYB2_MONRO|nr:hypothetical protein Moror_9785 [Moniliophthora roreri MCA 2997]
MYIKDTHLIGIGANQVISRDIGLREFESKGQRLVTTIHRVSIAKPLRHTPASFSAQLRVHIVNVISDSKQSC